MLRGHLPVCPMRPPPPRAAGGPAATPPAARGVTGGGLEDASAAPVQMPGTRGPRPHPARTPFRQAKRLARLEHTMLLNLTRRGRPGRPSGLC